MWIDCDCYVGCVVANLLEAWLPGLCQHRAIAVIRSPDQDTGLQMAKAVVAGGIQMVEVTWTSEHPAALITSLRQSLPHCWVGAGSIITVAQLQEAIAAGSQFLVSPYFNPVLVQTALAAQVPVVPGALSPTEILTAWQAGASSVKVFPIQSMGGVQYLQQLRIPLGHPPLIPTGGVTLANARSMIEAGAIAVGLSGQLFPKEAIANQDWQTVRDRAQDLMDQLHPVQSELHRET